MAKDIHKIKQARVQRRIKRARAKIFGTAKRPRLAVFRSHKHIACQLIDDAKGRTCLAVSDRHLGKISKEQKEIIGDRAGKIAAAFLVGYLLAEKAIKQGIKKVVFDRRSYKYHGRVRAVAEGSRTGGLQF